jgi:cobalt/nickel transport system permease protein
MLLCAPSKRTVCLETDNQDPLHIPDGFLSARVAGTAWAVSAVGVTVALRAERREAVPVSAGVLGSLAAFLFAAQMVNVPVAPGTSGHLIGATLAGVLVGPWRGVIVVAVVLAVQALLFQDGGIAAYGANLADMGLVGSLVGCACALLVARAVRGLRGYVAGAVAGAFVSTIAAASLASLWLACSGLYPLSGILPLMLATHSAIGVLEAALTGAVLATVLRWRPDLARGFDLRRSPAAGGGGARVLLGAALVVAAFLAPLASTLPDGLERTAQLLGFASREHALMSAPMKGYALPPGGIAPVVPAVAGILGTLAVAALAWSLSRGLAGRSDDAHR